MNTKEKLKQEFKKINTGDFIKFSRKTGCPDCGSKRLFVRPIYPGCTDMVNVACHKCQSGWGETVEEFLTSNPEKL